MSDVEMKTIYVSYCALLFDLKRLENWQYVRERWSRFDLLSKKAGGYEGD